MLTLMLLGIGVLIFAVVGLLLLKQSPEAGIRMARGFICLFVATFLLGAFIACVFHKSRETPLSSMIRAMILSKLLRGDEVYLCDAEGLIDLTCGPDEVRLAASELRLNSEQTERAVAAMQKRHLFVIRYADPSTSSSLTRLNLAYSLPSVIQH